MTTPHLEELRELSRRSRRAQHAAFLALLTALLLYPLQLLAARWIPPTWAATAALTLAGAGLLRYAYLAGEERGAFRRVFRRLADERRTRTIVPADAQTPAQTLAQRR